MQPYLPCCDLQPLSRVITPMKKDSEEGIVSFERTKTNHVKLPRENNSQRNNNASNYIPHNLHKLSSCVF